MRDGFYYKLIIMNKNLRPCFYLTMIIILQLIVRQVHSGCLIPFCATCPNIFACVECAPNYCLSGFCFECGAKIPKCISCSSCTTCTVCETKYALNGGSCQLCSVTLPRCSTCSSTTSCTTCISPNQMIGTDCCSVAMPFCTGCKSNPSACDNCISTSYCKQTPATCVTCSSAMLNCVTCSSCTACTKCTSNLYAINSNTKCQLCSELMPQCVNCAAAAVCTLCTAPDYGITTGSQCGKCPQISPHCTTCTSYSYCTACESTQYAINPAHLCQSCSTLMPHCFKCSSAVVCLQCEQTYTVNPAKQCQLCTITIPNCNLCSAVNVCNVCYGGFFLVGFQSCCNVPMPFCTSCKNDPNLCDACINDKYYMPTPVLCSLCKNAIPYCAKCTPNGTICLECFAGFIFDSQFHCQKCSDFVDNCGFCNNTPACTACLTLDYVLNDTLHCQLCINFLDDCQTCVGKTACISCLNDTMAVNPIWRCGYCNVSLDYCTNCFNYTHCKTCVVDPDIILTFNLQCKTCAQLVPECLKCESQFSCQLDQCTRSYGIKYINGHKKCILCSQMMAGCSTCRNDMQCTRCSLGEIVQGGCSQVIGCLQVDASKPKSPCIRCDISQFHHDPVNQSCKCLAGWKLAGLHCTDIIGCTRVEKTSLRLICVLCDRNGKFLPRNGTCVCEKYYEPKGQICSEICGDGRRIKNECDDGNKLSGDGCSSTCKIQYKYLCSDDLKGKSHCVYDGNIRLVYACTYKLLIPNSIQVVFDVRPYISNLQKSKMNNLLIKPGSIITINDFSFKNKQLRINLTYSQSLEGLKGSLKFVFDSYYTKSKPAILSFPFKECNGKPLDYESVQTPFKGIMSEVSYYLNIVAFFNLLLGSLATRMIGVQTINAIQLIAMSQAFAPKYYPTIEGMNGFTNSIGGFQNAITNSTIVEDPTQLQRLNYSADFIGNTLLIIIFQFSSIGLYALLMISQKYKIFQKVKIKYCLNKKMDGYKQFLYRFLIFPSYAGFIFNIFFANFVLTYKIIDKAQITQMRQNSIFSLLTMIIFTLVVNNQWKNLFLNNKDQQQTLQKPKYIAIYLGYTFIINIMAQLCVLGFIKYKIYAMSGLVAIYLIMLIVYRPYNYVLHNAVLIINQIGVLFAFVWLFLQEILVFTRDIQEILGYSLAGYISLISLLAIIRSIVEIKKKYFTKKDQNSAKDDIMNDDNNKKKKISNDVDDYLRKYYRRNVDAKAQKMQNKMLQRYMGNQRQTDFNIDTHIGQVQQPTRYRLKQILQSQRNTSALKNPLRQKMR